MPRTAKRKPIRFADVYEMVDGKTAVVPTVEQREFRYREHQASSTGQVLINWDCVFCGSPIVTYLWSLCGGGKRCGVCKALYSGRGTGVQWKDQTVLDDPSPTVT